MCVHVWGGASGGAYDTMHPHCPRHCRRGLVVLHCVLCCILLFMGVNKPISNLKSFYPRLPESLPHLSHRLPRLPRPLLSHSQALAACARSSFVHSHAPQAVKEAGLAGIDAWLAEGEAKEGEA